VWKKACRASRPGQSPHLLAFLAHMLVELLLDAAILDRRPELGRRYYTQLRRVDPGEVQRFVEAVTGRSAAGLPAWIDRFCLLPDEAFDSMENSP